MPAKENQAVELPELVIGETTIQIIGTTPLIVHRFSDDSIEKIQEKQSGAAKLTKAPRDPQREFEQAMYMLESGGYGFPASGIKNAMVSAGMRYGDEVGTRLWGAFNIPAELVEIITPNQPKMRVDHVVIGMATGEVRYRPQFMPWSMRIPFNFSARHITPDRLINLLRLAGFCIGIGDWRVEKKGTYGQFTVGDIFGPGK